MALKKWLVHEIDKEKVKEYAEKCQISPLATALLCARNISSTEKIKEFLNETQYYENPFDFIDMDKAVERIQKALVDFEKICIYGDYDADGITSTALMYDYLKNRGGNVICYVPERDRDGYGLNNKALDIINDKGVDIIFTVDNGVSAYNEVEYAKSLGMDVVITDHHRVHGDVPKAYAVVNPYRDECKKLKYKNYAGVGVAFKFVQAMEYGKEKIEYLLNRYSDLITLGTIGDSIALYGETKNIVKYGLKNISNSKRPGVKSILKCSGLIGKEIDSLAVAFGMVPRLNACGRMNNAEFALRILLSETEEESEKLCEELNRLNESRKETENKILESVEKLLNENPQRKYEKIIIAEGENWNHGVLGIVASRIVQKYGKPCILITTEGELSRASCRSIEGFSIYEVLTLCSEHLVKFGGHPLAAGFSLETCNIEKFKCAVKCVCEKFPTINDILVVDVKLNPKKISVNMLYDLEILKPFGNGNPEPVFGFFNMTLKKIRPIGQGKHLKLTFVRDGCSIDALYFNKSPNEFLYYENEVLDIAVNLHKNIYKDIVSITIQILDLKLSSVNITKILENKRIYENFKQGYNLSYNELESLVPSRSELASVYKYLRLTNNKLFRDDLLSQRVFGDNKNSSRLYIIIDILEDLGLINVCRNADEYRVDINNIHTKVKIEDSTVLKFIQKKKGEILNGRRN